MTIRTCAIDTTRMILHTLDTSNISMFERWTMISDTHQFLLVRLSAFPKCSGLTRYSTTGEISWRSWKNVNAATSIGKCWGSSERLNVWAMGSESLWRKSRVVFGIGRKDSGGFGDMVRRNWGGGATGYRVWHDVWFRPALDTYLPGTHPSTEIFSFSYLEKQLGFKLFACKTWISILLILDRGKCVDTITYNSTVYVVMTVYIEYWKFMEPLSSSCYINQRYRQYHS